MSPLAQVQRRLARLSLDPLPGPSSLRQGEPIAGKRILVTGASSGVGRAAPCGSRPRGRRCSPWRAARTSSRRSVTGIAGAGGTSYSLPCDLTDADAIDALTEDVITRFGGVDVLVNNAGHSIRRSAADTAERPYDHDRLMRLNYHAPVRLTLNLLGPMRTQGGGQIINSSTWGVPGGLMPMFTAYHASKAALAAFSRSLQAEERRRGILITSLHFPLMRTPMIAPTEKYAGLAALEPEDAAALGGARRPAPPRRDDAGVRHHARRREALLAAARGASGALCPPVAGRRSTKDDA